MNKSLRNGCLLFVIVLGVSGCTSNSEPPVETEPVEMQAEVLVDQEKVEEIFSPAPRIEVILPSLEQSELPQSAVDIADHAALAEIQEVIESGAVLLSEDGQFRPEEKVTRGEFMTWMYRYDSKGIKPHRPNRGTYPDLSAEHPYFSTIEGITAAGVVMGYPDGTIGVDLPLSREEIGLIWGRYQQDGNVMNPFDNIQALIPYKDKEKISQLYIYAVGGYRQLYKEVFGDEEELRPKQAVTRAEAARWMVKGPKGVGGEVEQVESPPRARLNMESSSEVVQQVEIIDITGHPVQDKIVWMIESGVIDMQGEKRFRPDHRITRRDFIHWMYQNDAKGIEPMSPSQPTFSDVASDDPSYGIVEGMVAKQRLMGDPEGTLRLDDLLTREELVLLWGEYVQHRSITEKAGHTLNALKYAKDGDKVGDAYRYAVGAYFPMMRTVFGNTPIINPQVPVTRAEAVQWIVDTTHP
ncbi:S-layer homology domain-containing protein [Ammoniphilus sp. CFH 90114]|uniref:S-layer homology domain-containing protein n=1 Tax=Ammoniphilus sp. CFH 90114 TaxID=2493665 RepID=UPI00100F2048|nr:S-layer homology domain-containing protein [Ammoniphilus sp. CFH 90114]RXT07826.1 S-layer homology domain-containing protein [Ammoniphilus sp. CFH 90114]